MVICLERGADLHMAQLMPLPLTDTCFSKVQTGFTFLVPAHPGSPGQRAVKWVCVCVCVCILKAVVVFKSRKSCITCSAVQQHSRGSWIHPSTHCRTSVHPASVRCVETSQTSEHFRSLQHPHTSSMTARYNNCYE